MTQTILEDQAAWTGFPSLHALTSLSSALILGVMPHASRAQNGGIQRPTDKLISSAPITYQSSDDILDIDTTSVCLPAKPSEKVAAVLAYHGLTADSITVMPEGSHLFDFTQDVEAWVEVDPNKDIVVVVKDGEFRDLYEFTTNDIHLLPKILSNAGVRGML